VKKGSGGFAPKEERPSSEKRGLNDGKSQNTSFKESGKKRGWVLHGKGVIPPGRGGGEGKNNSKGMLKDEKNGKDRQSSAKGKKKESPIQPERNRNVCQPRLRKKGTVRKKTDVFQTGKEKKKKKRKEDYPHWGGPKGGTIRNIMQ